MKELLFFLSFFIFGQKYIFLKRCVNCINSKNVKNIDLITYSIKGSTTHCNDGGSRRAGEVLDDLPIGLLNWWGVRCFWCIRRVRLRGWRRGFGTRRIEQQFDAGFTAVIAAAHMLPEAGPSPGAPGSTGYRSRADLALSKNKEKRFIRLIKCVFHY